MNRERAWNIITLLYFIDLLLLVFKVFSASPIKEPEFINSYCIMTSDDSFELLPKEIGTINSYQNNSPKLSSVVDKVSPKQSVAMDSIPSTKGKDIVLEGGHSSYVVPKDMKTISLVIKAKDNELDPMGLYPYSSFQCLKEGPPYSMDGVSTSSSCF